MLVVLCALCAWQLKLHGLLLKLLQGPRLMGCLQRRLCRRLTLMRAQVRLLTLANCSGSGRGDMLHLPPRPPWFCGQLALAPNVHPAWFSRRRRGLPVMLAQAVCCKSSRLCTLRLLSAEAWAFSVSCWCY